MIKENRAMRALADNVSCMSIFLLVNVVLQYRKAKKKGKLGNVSSTFLFDAIQFLKN